jgi:segregation and condensation protein A
LSYLVHLQQFEGPLGLLLYLIRKEEMDIFDIKVGEITHQYLEYIRQMKELDLEVAGDFVAMAATLLQIKSRMLLPQYNEEGEIVETEDPRKELVQKLLDYQKYQEAAKKLYDRPLLGRDVFTRGTRLDYGSEEMGEIITEDDAMFSLITAYRRAVKKALRAVHRVRPKGQSIAARIMEMSHRLVVGARVLLSDLLKIGGTPNRTQLLVTFLSVLELGRMGFVTLFQNETYGDIHIEAKKVIDYNVMERVQEFETLDADFVAKSIINEAVEQRIDEKIDMAEAMDTPGPAQLSLDESSLVADDGEYGGEQGLEMQAVSESEMALEMASDEDIFAAETALNLDHPTENINSNDQQQVADVERETFTHNPAIDGDGVDNNG